MTTVKDFVHKSRYPNPPNSLDETRCAFSVHEKGRGVWSYQCQKGIKETIQGVGFCGIHAKEVKRRLGIQAKETKTKFAARFENGEPSILRLSIISETDKTIEIQDIETVLNGGFGFLVGFQRKDNPYTRKYKLFFSEEEALHYLVVRAKDYIDSLSKELEEAKLVYEKLMASWYKK